MLENGIDEWKKTAKALGLRNAQDAVVEFLKIGEKVLSKEVAENLKLDSFKYLIDHAKSLSNE